MIEARTRAARCAALAARCLLTLAAACSAAPKKGAAETSATAAPAPTAAPEAVEFCTNYFNLYCEHSQDDDGRFVESLYGELPTADQRQLREECEAEFTHASQAQREAMTACLGCVAECSATKSCLQGAGLCDADLVQ